MKIRTLAVCVPVLTVSMIAIWALGPRLWFPSFDDLDHEKLKIEAELLQSRCSYRTYPETLSAKSRVKVELSEIPYISSLDIRELVANEYSVICGVGTYVPLWNDWWVSEAGIFILNDSQELPDWLELDSERIGDGIFKYFSDG